MLLWLVEEPRTNPKEAPQWPQTETPGRDPSHWGSLEWDIGVTRRKSWNDGDVVMAWWALIRKTNEKQEKHQSYEKQRTSNNSNKRKQKHRKAKKAKGKHAQNKITAKKSNEKKEKPKTRSTQKQTKHKNKT